MHTEFKTKALFYITNYFESIGRAIIVAGVDFEKSGAWLTETYVIFPDSEMSDGLRVINKYDSDEISEEWLPTIESELNNRIKYCESIVIQQIRKKDKELALHLHSIHNLFKNPLTPREIVQIHISGEFQEQIISILNFTECKALKAALNPVKNFPQLNRITERQNNAR